MTFRGFSDDAFHFYERLAADNTRTFWQANKGDYRRFVREPMDELLGELGEYGPFHVFRPNKDVRFSKDKTPYKDHIGAYGESEGGAGQYVQLSAAGMFAGSGYYEMATDQLDRLRRAIDAPATGAEIDGLCRELRKRGQSITAMSELKTAPRGYPRDHPRIELLRLKGVVATRQWPVAAWIKTKAVTTRVRDTWVQAADLNAWLDTHVGPSQFAPDENELARFGPL